MRIAVFGSVNIDLTAYVDELPRPGVTAHARGHFIGLGGKGANQAVAAQRLGEGDVRFVAAAGNDAFGTLARELLEGYGVAGGDVRVREDAPTGIALIHVDAASQNAITVIGGANLAWQARDIGPDMFEGANVALFQLETPPEATAAAMAAAREAGAIVILDPAPAPHGGIPALVALADIVTPNESEAAALTGIAVDGPQTAIRAAQALVAQGCDTAIVKLGARGLVFAQRSGRTGTVEPFAVEAIDTVAAGDSFNGGLAAALAGGAALDEALAFASAAGALATTRPGAAASVPSRREALELAATHGR